MEFYHYIIALGGAFVAGCVNTLAGNGSAITLSILTEMIGLPGNMANGTNRIGVLFNGAGGTLGFYRGGKLDISKSRPILVPTVVGAIVGAYISTLISNEQFMLVFRYLMILMLLVLLVKPDRWLFREQGKSIMPAWLSVLVFGAVGFYGGFIQMGMGIFFLAAMVLAARVPLIRSNAVKVFAVTIYTLLAVGIYQWHGLIDWPIGLLMGAGQFAGGWVTAHYASKYPQANVWAYWLLVIIIVLSLLSMFGLF